LKHSDRYDLIFLVIAKTFQSMTKKRFQTLYFRGCLQAWFFSVGPPRQYHDLAAMTVIMCDGSALICCQMLGKHERMYQKRFSKHIWEC